MADTERKKPVHQKWAIEHSEVADQHMGDPAMNAEYQSLGEAEAACRKLALDNVGVSFRAVKRGREFLARVSERVVLTSKEVTD